MANAFLSAAPPEWVAEEALPTPPARPSPADKPLEAV